MRALFVLLPVLAFAACTPSDECMPSDTRCNGDHVEVCGNDHTWVFQENCDTLGGPNAGVFACQAYTHDAGDTAHACMQVVPDGGQR
jgi:hypothetical protein